MLPARTIQMPLRRVGSFELLTPDGNVDALGDAPGDTSCALVNNFDACKG